MGTGSGSEGSGTSGGTDDGGLDETLDGDGATSAGDGGGDGEGSGDGGSGQGSDTSGGGADDSTSGDSATTGTSRGDSGMGEDSTGAESTGTTAVCGDGQVEGDEVCDDGVNDGAYGGCNADCLSLAGFCGDAEVNGPEACDDGTNDGAYAGCNADCLSLAGFCGDSEVNGPEQCDDANADSADGCLASCEVPGSCLEILDFDAAAGDGSYLIGPVAPDSVFSVQCDMTTDGGGWTGIETRHLCSDLATTLTPVQAAPVEGIDEECRPFTQDGAGNHTYTFDVLFPPGFDAFYFSGYTALANASGSDTSEVEADVFVQSTWDAATGNQHGDISFGSADEPGPVTSFGAEGTDFECTACEEPFPTQDTAYELGATSTTLRIGWGEGGPQIEGWVPWAAGTIFVR